MARLFLVALLALVGCANAFTSPSAGVSRSAVTRATPVEMIGKKSAAKPKKAAKKDDGFWANFGLADFAMAGRGLELLNPTVNKYVPPEKYDTRSIKAKKVIKSGKVNPKDTSTW